MSGAATTAPRAMRDAVIDRIRERMGADPSIVFLCADFGSPALDRLREAHGGRFFNVGIAEQNLIAVSAGLALEGRKVFAYAIAPFITLRCYEQIRVNLAILSQLRPMNVNLIGVGAGVSYDVSGPTHHCLEDLAAMRLLGNVRVTSPADHPLAAAWVDEALAGPGIRYLRLDSKPLPVLSEAAPSWKDGFRWIRPAGADGLLLVATGWMTHRALEAADRLKHDGGAEVGVLEVFDFARGTVSSLGDVLRAARRVISAEEGFIQRGGLDAYLRQHGADVTSFGFDGAYRFEIGSRAGIHEAAGLGLDDLIRLLRD